MVEMEGCSFWGCFVVVAMVLVKGVCSPLVWKQAFAVMVVPRYSLVFEAVFELEAMYSLVAVVEPLKLMAASLAAVWVGQELVEPKFGFDFVPDPRNSLSADHALEGAGPMMPGTGTGQVLVPMDLNWVVAVLEVVIVLLASKVPELAGEIVMESTHSKAAVAAESELRPRVVEVEPVLGSVAMLVVKPAVVAEPMVAADEILVEMVEPKEVVLEFVARVAMVVDFESLYLLVETKRPAAAAVQVLEVDPNLAAFAVDVVAHELVSRMTEPVAETAVALEAGPRMAEHVSGFVLPLETGSKMAELEGAMYL